MIFSHRLSAESRNGVGREASLCRFFAGGVFLVLADDRRDGLKFVAVGRG